QSEDEPVEGHRRLLPVLSTPSGERLPGSADGRWAVQVAQDLLRALGTIRLQDGLIVKVGKS
ncbi:hypothetical protein K7G98_36595, partial [Saccharothrix sp. MB29]|nr:hypothetical protein [Saccharothrix sp. MB29]